MADQEHQEWLKDEEERKKNVHKPKRTGIKRKQSTGNPLPDDGRDQADRIHWST